MSLLLHGHEENQQSDYAAWGMSHVTVDMGQGTIQMSGLYEDLIRMSAAVRAEAFFPSDRVLHVVPIAVEGCRLILHAMSAGFDHPGALKLVIASWYFWICCQRSCLFPLMANLASNDVMQRHNDAVHSQHLFAHCLLWKAEGMCPMNACCSDKCLHKVMSQCMWTYCTSVSPQSSWNTPTATHLPPVVPRHCCCVIYFRKG